MRWPGEITIVVGDLSLPKIASERPRGNLVLALSIHATLRPTRAGLRASQHGGCAHLWKELFGGGGPVTDPAWSFVDPGCDLVEVAE